MSPARPVRANPQHASAPSATIESRSLPRFEGLDGLRALAIAAVLVYHLDPGWLPGGFLGVDVFFVISGFLITSLLVHEIGSTGRLDARRFWTRRARRLVPALVLVVLVSSLVARLVSSDLVVALGRQVLGAATFSTNWVEIFAGQSYFDRTAPALFMNFWSLAVEEQFYLFWPLVALLLITRATPRTRIGVTLGIGALSTLLMAVLVRSGEDATRVYYGTDTHLFGLMLGAGLAFAWCTPTLRRDLLSLYSRNSTAWVAGALVLLAAGMLLLSEDSVVTFRGGIAISCLATAVLIVAAVHRSGPRTRLQTVLDAAPARWVGERSYGIYLWHWPVILIVGSLLPTAVGTGGYLLTRLLCVLVTLAVAEASYRYLEQPVRRLGFRGSARAVGGWLLTLPRNGRLAVSTASAVVLVLFVAVVATAPAQSSTAEALKGNQAAAEADAAQGPAQVGVLPLSEQAKQKGFAMPTGAEIDGFGDSMMVGSVHALKYYFPEIRLDAKSNRRWSGGLTSVQQRGADTRRAVILDFGTNAGMDPQAMRDILDALGPDRMVVVVNLYGRFARVPADNATLAEIVQGRDNVIIADWQATVRAHPDALQPDGIHPSLRGAHYYSATIRQAFATLSEQHTGQKVPLTALPMP